MDITSYMMPDSSGNKDMDMMDTLNGGNDYESSNTIIETVNIKDEASTDDREISHDQEDTVRVSSPVNMVGRSPKKKAKMEVDDFEDGKTVKKERFDQFDDLDFNPIPSNYLLLKGILQEAKVTAEKAQECAIEISHSQDVAANNIMEYFTQVASSIDQAVISTTIGLTALESILLMRGEVKVEDPSPDDDYNDDDFVLKEDFQNDDSGDDNSNEYIPPSKPKSKTAIVDGEQIYKCTLCTYSTKVKSYLSDHTRSQHEPKRFKCERCDYLSRKPYDMKLHMKKTHQIHQIEYICERENPEVKFFLCQKCPFGNTDQELLEEHINKKHKTIESNEDSENLQQNVKEEIKNPIVLKKVNKRRKVKKEDLELQKHEGDEVLSCTRCSYTTKNKVFFDDHVNGVYKYLKCYWCDYHFVGPRFRFHDHLRDVHGLAGLDEHNDATMKCPECDFTISDGRKLFIHCLIVHQNGPLFHCSKCQYSGRTWKLLESHMEDHNQSSIQCDQCPHIAKSKLRLQKHINQCHKQAVLCDDCGTECSNGWNLKHHKQKSCKAGRKRITYGTRKKRAQELLKCSFCDFTTYLMGKLKQHYTEEHKEPGSTKEIEYKCEQCDHVSTTLNDIYYHNTMEHTEKVFHCDECDFSAAAGSYLRIHKENKHSPHGFPCDVCGMVFKVKMSLRRHIKTKHSADPADRLSCKIAGCNYTTSAKANMKLQDSRVQLHNQRQSQHEVARGKGSSGGEVALPSLRIYGPLQR